MYCMNFTLMIKTLYIWYLTPVLTPTLCVCLTLSAKSHRLTGLICSEQLLEMSQVRIHLRFVIFFNVTPEKQSGILH